MNFDGFEAEFKENFSPAGTPSAISPPLDAEREARIFRVLSESEAVSDVEDDATTLDAPPDAPPDAAAPPGRLAAQRRYSSVAATCDDIASRAAKVRLWQPTAFSNLSIYS